MSATSALVVAVAVERIFSQSDNLLLCNHTGQECQMNFKKC